MTARSWFHCQPGFHSHAQPVRDDRSREMGPRIGDTTVTEYWDGQRWQERLQRWNGERFVIVEGI